MARSPAIPPFREIQIGSMVIPDELQSNRQMARLLANTECILASETDSSLDRIDLLRQIVQNCAYKTQYAAIGRQVVDRIRNGYLDAMTSRHLFASIADCYVISLPHMAKNYMSECLMTLITNLLRIEGHDAAVYQPSFTYLLDALIEIYTWDDDQRGTVHAFVARYLRDELGYLHSKECHDPHDTFLLNSLLRLIGECRDRIVTHQSGPMPLTTIVQGLQTMAKEAC